MNKMISMLIAAAAALGIAVLAPAAASAAPAIDCARQPYGVTGCEAYLGRVARQREGLNLPRTSDYTLGRAVRLMCFGADHEADLRLGPGDKELVDNIRLVQRRTVPGYCG